MAVSVTSLDGDHYLCSTHPSHVVALYCQTCEDLICPRCISQGPSSTGDHKQHVYLDLTEAYDLKKEEFNKVIANFHDTTQSRKNERAEIHSKIQHLKLELLRKKTEVAKQIRSLRDTISRHERQYTRHLEAVVQPAVTRKETVHREIDYEVVSRDGLLAGAECIQKIPQEKCIQFLRGQSQVEKEMIKLSSRADFVPEDPLQELTTLKLITLAVHREKYMIRQALSCPKTIPAAPRFLPSWSTVDHKSANLVFKFSRKVPVDHFLVSCHPYSRGGDSVNTHKENTIQKSDSFQFKLKKFISNRVNVTLRGLKPNTKYRAEVVAVNSHGSSEPAQCYFTTTYSLKRNSCIRFHKPKSRKFQCCRKFISFVTTAVSCVFLAVVLIWALYSMYLSHDVVYAQSISVLSYVCDLIWHQNFTLLNNIYEELCPQKIPSIAVLSSLGDSEPDIQHSMSQDHSTNGSVKSQLDMLWDWVLMMIDRSTTNHAN